MPQPRVPLNILKLRGSVAQNPKRFKERENEPMPKAALGDPPPHLAKDEIECWHELVRTAPYGVIADCDAWSVELAVCLMAEFRRSGSEMPASRLNLLHSLLGRFGFNPADRSRVNVPRPEKPNRFDDDF